MKVKFSTFPENPSHFISNHIEKRRKTATRKIFKSYHFNLKTLKKCAIKERVDRGGDRNLSHSNDSHWFSILAVV